MEEVLQEVLKHLNHLIGRMHGPLAFRLIIQPLVAIILAIRAGLKDARSGQPAYGWAVITGADHRWSLLRDAWQDTAKVFVAAVIIDLTYEVIVFRRIYPGQTLMVATTLALLPYLLVRGPANRIAQRWRVGEVRRK